MLELGSFWDLALITILGVGVMVPLLVALWLQALERSMVYRISAVEHGMTYLCKYVIIDICIYFPLQEG